MRQADRVIIVLSLVVLGFWAVTEYGPWREHDPRPQPVQGPRSAPIGSPAVSIDPPQDTVPRSGQTGTPHSPHDTAQESSREGLASPTADRGRDPEFDRTSLDARVRISTDTTPEPPRRCALAPWRWDMDVQEELARVLVHFGDQHPRLVAPVVCSDFLSESDKLIVAYEQLRSGVRYMMLGVCGWGRGAKACGQIELRLISPTGSVLRSLQDASDSPAAVFQAPMDGDYRLELTLGQCRGTCLLAAAIFQLNE